MKNEPVKKISLKLNTIHFLIMSLCALSFVSKPAFATDVNPNKKLGQVKVTTLPTPNFDERSTYSNKDLTVKFSIAPNKQQIQLNTVYDVAVGIGCLEISYRGFYNFNIKKCNIEIKEKQLTEVNLKGLQFIWDVSQFVADVGPMPQLSLVSLQPDLVATLDIFLANPKHNGALIWLPEGEIGYEIGHKFLGKIDHKSLDWNENLFLQKNLNPPTDYRSTLTLDFIDGEATLPVNQANQMLIYFATKLYSDKAAISDLFNNPVFGSSIMKNNEFYQAYRYRNQAKKQSIKIYPIKQNDSPAYYYLSLNEQRMPLPLVAGQELIFSMGTINLHQYSDQKNGSVRIFSNQYKLQEFVEIKFPIKFYGGYQTYEFETPTAWYFPYGFKYRFDFYTLDDLGRKSLQDQVVVNLENQ